MPAMAGCNVQDWYNKKGDVNLVLTPLADENSLVDQFKSVKVALYGVTLRQRGAINPANFGYDEPKIIDLVPMAREGEELTVTKFTTSLLPTVRVFLKLVVIEAIDAAGTSLMVCRPVDTPERFPCFYQPADDVFEPVDLSPFSPPRGGTVTVHIPIAVKYAQQGRVSEYFLFSDPALVELENKR